LEDLYVIEDDGDLKQFTLGGWNVTDFKNLKMIFEGSEPLVFEARDGDYLEIDQTIAVGYGNNYSVNVYCSRSLLGDYPDNKVLWAFNTTNLWSGDYEIITHIFFGENGEYTTEARYYSYNIVRYEGYRHYDFGVTADQITGDIFRAVYCFIGLAWQEERE